MAITPKPIHDITAQNASQVPDHRRGTPVQFIVIHYLGVANADNPNLYGGGYGGHFNITRDGTIYKAADPKNDVVWQCGGSRQGYDEGSAKFFGVCTNYNSIGIENGVNYDGTWYFSKETQESLVYLVSKLMDEFKVPIDHVIRHWDVTGKHCPAPYVENNGYKTNWTWNEFKQKLAAYRGGSNMPKVLVVDPATSARDGWHDVYGTSDDALNGNVSRVFLTGVTQSVPTTKCRQPDDWSCGPYSLAECLGQPNGEDARSWLLARGLITPQHGTEYSGIVGYLGAQGYSCLYDGKAHDGEMTTEIFQKIINHLQAGYKVILCMHGTSKGCRTNYWTKSGHYICVYGIKDVGPTTTYSFRVEQVKIGDKGKYVMLGQKLLKSRGMYTGKLDQSFGPQMQKAVLDYQKYINKHGGSLKEDGILGPATWTNIIGIAGNVKTVKQVKLGDKGIDVFLCQQILKGTGYYKGALDQKFSKELESALKAFQKTAKITQDGICGPTSFRIMIGVE